MASERVPVDLVSGFRGAGKTTLLQALSGLLWQNESVLFLQNERGRARLSPSPARHLRFVEGWSGGCICCSAAVLFGQALADFAQQYRPDRVVIELAETARLSDVKTLFEQLGSGYSLEHILYVLDALDFNRRWDLSRRFLERQLHESPALLLNKTEHTDAAHCQAIVHIAEEVSPKCAVFQGNTDLASLYQSGRIFRRIGFRDS